MTLDELWDQSTTIAERHILTGALQNLTKRRAGGQVGNRSLVDGGMDDRNAELIPAIQSAGHCHV